MGACCSAPEAEGGEAHANMKATELVPQSSLLPGLQSSAADPGLLNTHEFVQLLGRGGTGDIAQFIDRATREHVAIKLVRRPVPRVVATSLLSEILVRPRKIRKRASILKVGSAMGYIEPVCHSSRTQTWQLALRMWIDGGHCSIGRCDDQHIMWWPHLRATNCS